MKRKALSIGTVAIILIAALGIIYSLFIVKMLVGEHGTVNSVSVLQKVYNKAGPAIAATFTNSVIQKFPFDGPIDWRLQFLKDPMVILMGKVDTNALRQFIKDNPSTQFGWSGIDKNGQNWGAEGWPDAKEYPTVTWESMSFRAPDLGTSNAPEYSAVIDCTVQFSSNSVLILSH